MWEYFLANKKLYNIINTNQSECSYFLWKKKNEMTYKKELIELWFLWTPGFGKKTTCKLWTQGHYIWDIILNIELPNVPIFNNWNEDIKYWPYWYILNKENKQNSKYYVWWWNYIGYNMIKNIE